MPNFPGPYELEFDISMGAVTPARSHKLRINVACVGIPPVGALLSAVTLQAAGGGTKTAQAAADQFWSFIRLVYAPSVACSGVTLWKYIPNTFAKDFVSSGTVAAPTGAGLTTQIAMQRTLSFRTANGSVLKVVMLEGNVAADTKTVLVPNASGTNDQRIAAYILSADNVALGRDDSYPVAAMFAAYGQNERIWRKVYRGT